MKLIIGQNILETKDYEFIVNTVNLKGVAGKGLAKQVKEKYPYIYKEYRRFCNDGSLRIGSPSVSYIKKDLFEEETNPIGIIHFPTKDDWKYDSKYSYIGEGLFYLAKNFKSNSIAFPPLGCGNGGLNIVIVYEMFLSYVKKFEIQNWDLFLNETQLEEIAEAHNNARAFVKS